MNVLTLLLGGNQRTSTVKKNIVGSILIKGVSIIISFFIVPITLSYVDKELYGIWLTLSSIVLWLNFFDIGLTLGLKNKLAEAVALEEWERARVLVSTTYAIMSIIFIPIMLITFAFIPLVDWCGILNVRELFRRDIVLTMYPLIACFCLQMVMSIITTVIAAFQRTAFSTMFNVIGSFFSLVILIILPHIAKPSLFLLALTISVSPVLVLSVASVFLYSHSFKNVRPTISKVDFYYAKDIFSLGGKFFIIQVQGIILYQSANILISNIVSPVEVSVYNIAYKYMCTGMMFYSIFMGPLWPAFTDAYTKRDYSWMKRMYLKMCYVCAFTIGIYIIMTIASPLVYKIWIGDKLEIPFAMTVFVAFYISVHSWRMLQDTLINGIGKIKLSTYISLIGLCFHIPFSFYLGRLIGTYGVVLSMIIINLIYVIVYTTQINLLIRNKATGIWNK